MGTLIIVLFVVGCALAGLGIGFCVLLWRTLGTHRIAMHELYVYLNERRAFPLTDPTFRIPPQEGRR